MNYITIGPAPCDEDCVQVGADDYHERARPECKRFIALIRSTLGPEPMGARLAIKSFPHDFGTYEEVVCYYDENSEEATEYAFKCESDSPSHWEPI